MRANIADGGDVLHRRSEYHLVEAKGGCDGVAVLRFLQQAVE